MSRKAATPTGGAAEGDQRFLRERGKFTRSRRPNYVPWSGSSAKGHSHCEAKNGQGVRLDAGSQTSTVKKKVTKFQEKVVPL